MSWTDERIELLKSLWSEGKSASEISDLLGNVTRNAVIGKAHRLGLSGRPSPIKKVKPAPKGKKAAAVPVKEIKHSAGKHVPVKAPVAPPARPAAGKAHAAAAPVAGKRQEIKAPAVARPVAVTPAKNKKAAEKQPIPVAEPVIPLRPEPKIDPSKLVSLLNLSERMCRWPVGDPKDAEFGFCGQPVAEGHLYCGAHVAMAYQISTKKSDERAKAEKRRKMALAAQMAMEDEEEEEVEVDVENLEDIEDIADGEDVEDIDSEDLE